MNTKKHFSEKDLNQITRRIRKLKQLLGKNHSKAILDNYDFIKLLNISLRTSKNWRDSQRIPYSRIGRKVYFRLSDIEKMLEENREE